ncbi:MAG: hypothetical protein ACXAAH_17065, partial [Promethearchaeota archaeon]
MNSINVDLDEMPMYSHTDDFSGHQYYTFMGYTLELYSRTEKRTVHDLDVIQIDIENIYKTDGRGVPQPAVFFSDKQVFRSTLNG